MVNSHDQADGEQHRRGELQLAAPHGERPVDDLHAGGDGDQTSSRPRTRRRRPARGRWRTCGGPTRPSRRSRWPRRRTRRTGSRTAACGQNTGSTSETMPKLGRIEDVHLGVPEDPEQVLPQQRVGAGVDVEERGAEVALEHQQEQRHGDDRDGEQQQELHDQDHPGEDRHLHQAHARRAHVEDGDDQVDRAGQRGDAGDLQAERPEVDAVGGREQRAGSSART